MQIKQPTEYRDMDVDMCRAMVASALEINHKMQYIPQDQINDAISVHNTTLKEYCERIRSEKQWADDVEISMLCRILQINVLIVQQIGNPVMILGNENKTES